MLLFGHWLAVGCCSIPSARKYFDRRLDPVQTLRQFQYGIETGQDRVAYATLSLRSQEQMSYGTFWLFLRGGEIQGFAGVSPRDVIVDAEFDPVWFMDASGERAAIDIWYENDALAVSGDQRFYFRNRDGTWEIDLIDIVNSMAAP